MPRKPTALDPVTSSAGSGVFPDNDDGPRMPTVLRRRTTGSRAHSGVLRAALTKIGRPYVCVGCENPGRWGGQLLTLDVDHIDGDGLNNLPENLRYLCPNCHRITATWEGRRGG